MAPDIIITAPLPPFLYDPLRADYRCHDYHAGATNTALLAAHASTIRGLVQGGGTVTPEPLLGQLPALEIISVFGVGYDGVPGEYCRRRGIKGGHTPDVLTDDVAAVAAGLILMTGRGFVRVNRFVHAGERLKRGAELTTRLAGRTVGILGLGRIGKAIAQRVGAMGMQVAYTGRKPQDVSLSTWCLGRVVDWKWALYDSKRAYPAFCNQNAHLWFDGYEELAGFAISEGGGAYFHVLTLAGYRFLYEEKLEWVLENLQDRIPERGPCFSTEITEHQGWEIRILERHGFHCIDTYFTRRFDLTRELPPCPPLEPGFVIVDMNHILIIAPRPPCAPMPFKRRAR